MNDIELIDAYLLNAMPADTKQTFEQRLSNEKQLRKDVEDVDRVIEGLRGVAFKARLQTYQQIFAAEEKKKGSSRIYYISGIAASVVAAVAVSWYILFFDSTDKYYTYFEPYPTPVIVRSGANQNFEEAFLMYERGDYAGAVINFEQASILTDEHKLYLALSYLGNNQPDKATPLLQSILTSQFAEQATWYLGLSLLLNDQTSAAQETLARIKPGHYEFDEAQEILKKLVTKR